MFSVHPPVNSFIDSDEGQTLIRQLKKEKIPEKDILNSLNNCYESRQVSVNEIKKVDTYCRLKMAFFRHCKLNYRVIP
jgi:hypothetical protein